MSQKTADQATRWEPVSVLPASLENLPQWMASLDDEDWQFVRRFVLASGSLKEMAEQYSVSYPTVRARLDRLIAKINAAESPSSRDAFERKIKILVADGQLSVSLGKELLTDYRRTKKRDES
jgi:hypothetical protein